MEIDRIQPVKGLKVERTGSEQERRRRRQSGQDFNELLETTMSEEGPQDKEQDKPKVPPEPKPHPTDTVTLSSDAIQPPFVSDLVSISSTAKVGAEMEEARHSVESDEIETHPDLLLLESKLIKQPKKPAPPAATPPENPDPDEPPANFDTIA